MTIGARVSHNAIVAGRNTCLVIGGCGMTRPDMTALAQERLTRDQHMVVVRTVSIMAIHAVFPDRRVLPDKGSALIGMAAVASGGD